jgi:uncharacterized protein (TIGR00730 family)
LPGGFGTFDELFETLTLVQTHKSAMFPIILMGSDYWKGLVDWIRNMTLENGYISPEDMLLMTVTDDPLRAIAIINDFYKQRAFQENFS